MEGSLELEPSAFEQIIANTLARLKETALFTPEELTSLRGAAATGSLSKAKEIEAILALGAEDAPK